MLFQHETVYSYEKIYRLYEKVTPPSHTHKILRKINNMKIKLCCIELFAPFSKFPYAIMKRHFFICEVYMRKTIVCPFWPVFDGRFSPVLLGEPADPGFHCLHTHSPLSLSLSFSVTLLTCLWRSVLSRSSWWTCWPRLPQPSHSCPDPPSVWGPLMRPLPGD